MRRFRNRPGSNHGTDRKTSQMTRTELSSEGRDLRRRGHKLSILACFVTAPRSGNAHGHSVRIPAIDAARNFNLAAAAQTSWNKQINLIQAVEVRLWARVRYG